MGGFLADELDEEYAAIGIIGYRISLNWPGIHEGPLDPPTAVDNASVLLRGLGEEYLLVDLAFPDAEEPFLASGEEFQVGNDRCVPGEHYQGLLFLDEAGAMEALGW